MKSRYTVRQKGKKETEFKKTGTYLVIVESPSKCKIIEGIWGTSTR
jgi:reverse gyrase